MRKEIVFAFQTNENDKAEKICCFCLQSLVMNMIKRNLIAPVYINTVGSLWHNNMGYRYAQVVVIKDH